MTYAEIYELEKFCQAVLYGKLRLEDEAVVGEKASRQEILERLANLGFQPITPNFFFRS